MFYHVGRFVHGHVSLEPHIPISRPYQFEVRDLVPEVYSVQGERHTERQIGYTVFVRAYTYVSGVIYKYIAVVFHL